MSVHSASADHLTTEPIATDKRSIGLWDVTRLIAGIAAGVVFTIGVVDLIQLSAKPGGGPLTQGAATDLSVAIVMTVCGLAVSWLSFAAQRAVDRRAEHHAEVSTVYAKLAANTERLDKLAAEVHELVATEQGQQVHSAKARTDVAKLAEDMTDVRLGLAEMAQRAPSEESLLNHLKAYIDTLFTEFRKQLDKTAEDHDTAGYLRAMHGRVNGARPHLHTINNDR